MSHLERDGKTDSETGEHFETISPDLKFDVIFIDGMHIYEQSVKDFANSVKHLNDPGLIIIHDVDPTDEKMAARERISVGWTGDVWKTALHINKLYKDFTYCALPIPPGYLVVCKGERDFQEVSIEFDADQEDPFLEVPFEFFHENREELLRPVTSFEDIHVFLEQNKIAKHDSLDPSIQDVDEHGQIPQSLREELSKKNRQLNEKDFLLSKNYLQLQGKDLLLQKKEEELHEKKLELQQKNWQLNEKDKQLQKQTIETHRSREFISSVHGSVGWRILNKIVKIRNWFLPDGTRRKRLYFLMMKGIKVFQRQGVRGLAYKFKYWRKQQKQYNH